MAPGDGPLSGLAISRCRQGVVGRVLLRHGRQVAAPLAAIFLIAGCATGRTGTTTSLTAEQEASLVDVMDLIETAARAYKMPLPSTRPVNHTFTGPHA